MILPGSLGEIYRWNVSWENSSQGQWGQVKTGKYGSIVATLKGWLNFLKNQNTGGSGHYGKRSPTLYVTKKDKPTLKKTHIWSNVSFMD